MTDKEIEAMAIARGGTVSRTVAQQLAARNRYQQFEQVAESFPKIIDPTATQKVGRFQKRSKDDPYKSDTERRYAEFLDSCRSLKWADGTVHPHSVVHWGYEAMAFRLPHWGVYWPDFLVFLQDKTIEFREIKGKGKYAIRDKAKAKFLDAKRLFPWFSWRMIQLTQDGEWGDVY